MKRFVPDSLTYEDGSKVSINDIKRRYAESDHGKILSGQLRWQPAMREGTTPDQWRKAFGADVNNLRHLDLSYGLVRNFARHFNRVELTNEDLEILLLTAQVHDWAEAVTGDISFIYKNENDEKEELAVLRTLLHQHLPEDRHSKSPKIPQVISALTDRETLRYKVFNIVEKIGYMRTAKRAFQVKDQFAEQQRSALHAMACQPFITNAPVVMNYCQEFPELSQFLLDPKVLPVWENIIADCDLIDFEKFYPGKGQQLSEKLPVVRQQWNEFITKNRIGLAKCRPLDEHSKEAKIA